MSDQGHAAGEAGSSSSAQPDMADISRILSVSDVVLEPRDYMVWRIRMESRLQSAELFDHVSGPVPPQPSQDWSKRDLKVRDFLIRHLPNHLNSRNQQMCICSISVAVAQWHVWPAGSNRSVQAQA